MTLNISDCARCGQPHDDLHVFEVRAPVDLLFTANATHWAMCPNTQQPVFFWLAEDE